MIGEVSLGGVYVPVLLVLAVFALLLTFVATRLLAFVGFYRIVAYRALVDVALFVLILGIVSLLTSSVGFAS